MRVTIKELSSTAIAGEVGRESGSEGVREVRRAQDNFGVPKFKSSGSADALHPLCPVGHLPLYDFFEIAQVEKDERRVLS